MTKPLSENTRPNPEAAQQVPENLPAKRPENAVAKAPAPQPPQKKPGGGGKGGPPPQPQVTIRPIAGPAKAKRRHWGLLFGFILLVILPTAGTGFYLWNVAHDQYASTTGFTVRQADTQPAADLLGGLSQFSGGSTSGDADVLYEFIQSQELVTRIDQALDLRTIYSKAWPQDPIFAYNPDGKIEDLLDHWLRMVRVSYDAGTGLIELRVLAFDPGDAQAISQAIVEESTQMINDLSAIARDDATRYAREELTLAEERLTTARQELTTFRSQSQIVDPNADIQVQMGLLNTLNQQLGETLITYDLLRETTRENDPRLSQAERQIEVIQERIAEERKKFGVGGANSEGTDYATLIAEFERLASDREFAEQAYVASRSAYDAAVAEAQRQSRYLATYIRPTRAELSEYPDRILLTGLVGLFLFLAWSILTLIYYSLRDRR